MSFANVYSEEQLVQVLGKPALRGEMPRWNPRFGVDTRPPPPNRPLAPLYELAMYFG
jgi:hypothetical protein